MANSAQSEELTLCWAAWDPANALVELSKDFTAKSGIAMKFEFVPWTNYADRFLNELNSKGKLCDLIIGNSQWIGGSAENGHYVKLNDFFDKEGIKMSDFVDATVVGYSQWPKNTPNYWALPAMGDVVGWTYRKDWFTRPELQKEFKEKYGWDLAAPETFDQFKQVAEFFQNREIDGKKVYGASIYTERGSEGVTMGVMDVLYSFGFKYENPDKPYDMEGFVNSAKSVKGLEFYKSLYDCCTPPGASNSYMGEGVDAFKSGQVAMHMNFAFTWPGLQKDEAVGGEKVGFFANPKGPDGEQFAQLGGQGISVVSYSEKQEIGAEIHQVVRQSGSAEEMVGARRLLLSEGGGRGSQVPRKPALRQDIPQLDGDREGFLGRAGIRIAAAGIAESASTTMSWPARALPRKRWTGWSKTGQRCSATKARSSILPRLEPVPRATRRGLQRGWSSAASGAFSRERVPPRFRPVTGCRGDIAG